MTRSITSVLLYFFLICVSFSSFAQKQGETRGRSQVFNFDVTIKTLETEDLEFDLDNTQGKYYALIISAQNYADENIRDLSNPSTDAQKLKETLTTFYSFEEDDVTYLQDPTRDDLINTLEKLTKLVSEVDNLLIFYAGHGDWDENIEVGYWLPTDAVKGKKSTYFPNGTLQSYIKGIPAQHTLLIADACFSGGIFETRALKGASKTIDKLYERKSRHAMTSGNLLEVPDQSVFMKYLMDRLRRNKEVYLSSSSLFYGFRDSVVDNNPNGNIPQFGKIAGTGDDGGEFIFIRKK